MKYLIGFFTLLSALICSGVAKPLTAPAPIPCEPTASKPCRAEGPILERAGFQIKPLTAQDITTFGMAENTAGVIVTDLDPEQPAWQAGLRNDMVILYVNHQATPDCDTFMKVVSQLEQEDFLLVRARIPHYGNRHLILRLK
jgi:hypothetical protein